jgi:two-component system sensor histidine kinase KdpD
MRIVSSGRAPTEDELAQVFDPFYRAATTASRASGAGIGLTVCKRLAEAMDGSVWAKAVDDGFEAGFSLPLETEAL